MLVGQLTGEFVPFNPAQLFLKGISMLSATSTTRNELRHVLKLLAIGDVRSVISETMPLEAAATAHTVIESERAWEGWCLNRPPREHSSMFSDVRPSRWVV